MLKAISTLFSLLTNEQKRRLLRLQMLMIVMAVLETMSILSIAPFISVATNIEGQVSLLTDYATKLSNHAPFFDQLDITLGLGGLVIIFLTMSSVVSVVTMWLLSRFGAEIGMDLGSSLYEHYLSQPWLSHSSSNSSFLTKQIAAETLRVSDTIIVPLLYINARLMVTIFIVCAIFLFNPTGTVLGVLVFGSAYGIVYFIVRGILGRNGLANSVATEQRFRLMADGFGGIKSILLGSKQDFFFKRFRESGMKLASARAGNQAIALTPRFFIELVAFVFLISVVLINTRSPEAILELLPMLGFYMFAVFKLLPCLQQIYYGSATIKGNVAALYAITSELFGGKMKNSQTNDPNHGKYSVEIGQIEKEVRLKKVSFSYPNEQKPVLERLDMVLCANQVTGLTGSSGCGKSTLSDVLMGLIKPDFGELLVDGKQVTNENLKSWMAKIAFVPQDFFLRDGTVMDNIAYAIEPEDVDESRVNEALRVAEVARVIENLAHGIHTEVGENGVQLSGGQRQRIAIARAVYQKSELLIFDEATSSLDAATEKLVIQNILRGKDRPTILMIAHRVTTLMNCDNIYFIDAGKIAGEGTYEQLAGNNRRFIETSLVDKKMPEDVRK